MAVLQANERKGTAMRVYELARNCVITVAKEFEFLFNHYEDLPSDIRSELGFTPYEVEEKLAESEDEIFTWYEVEDFLGKWLSDEGEIVVEAFGKSYWGRTCFGQALYMDDVFQRIAKKHP